MENDQLSMQAAFQESKYILIPSNYLWFVLSIITVREGSMVLSVSIIFSDMMSKFRSEGRVVLTQDIRDETCEIGVSQSLKFPEVSIIQSFIIN